MGVENHMGKPFSPDSPEMKTQICVVSNDTEDHLMPKDYSSYLNFITVYMVSLSALFLFCFRTEMKRTNADENSKDKSLSSKKMVTDGLKGADPEQSIGTTEERETFVVQHSEEDDKTTISSTDTTKA